MPRHTSWGLATLSVLGLATATTSAAAQDSVLIVADDAYPPFVSANEAGELHGVYVPVLEAVFDRLDGYAVETDAVPWNRGLRMVEDGEALAIYPPYETSGGGRPYIDRYSAPILTERVVLVCDQSVDTAGRTAWPDDFHGLTIANNSGYRSPGDAFFEAVERGDITLQETPSTVGNVRKLLTGRVDCYVNAALSIQAALNEAASSPADRERVVEVLTLSENTGHLGYARDAEAFPFKDAFADAVDAVLEEMAANGEIDALIAGYLTN